ncbi:MAG: L,D-transpeptidase [Gemmatimonadaceae bacterium]
MSTSTEPAAVTVAEPTGYKRVAVALLSVLGIAVIGSGVFVGDTLGVRYERDVNRMVFNDNTGLLSDTRRQAGLEHDSLSGLLAAAPPPVPGQPYIVVSIEDHRLWFRRADSILFTAPVTTGSGMVLERIGGDSHWKFETPRGRLTVVSKEQDPIWVPPDWHYVELAQNRGLGVQRLSRGQRIQTRDGGAITVIGSDVMRVSDSGVTAFSQGEGREIVADGNLIVPPFGTNQRKFRDVLGTHRLNLGDGYAIHGTNKPELIGRSVSHGCVRLLNEDIAKLYELAPVGTPVFIY